MKIQTEIVTDVAIVRVIGEFDSRSNEQIDKALKDLAYSDQYRVVMDLTAVRFMGIQTLNTIISNLKEVRAGGGDIRFLNPHKRVVDYLKQNRLIELFKIFTTRREAIESFGPIEKKSARDRVSVDENASVVDAVKAEANTGSSDTSSSEEAKADPVDFESGSVLFANSCMIASTIHLLQKKGILTEEEAETLLNYDSLSFVKDSIADNNPETDNPEPSNQ